MQKIISIILALVLGLITFAGCGADETISGAETTDDTALETSSEETLEETEQEDEETESDETEADETESDEIESDETESDETESDETESDETESEEIESEETESEEAESKETTSKKTESKGTEDKIESKEESEEVKEEKEEKETEKEETSSKTKTSSKVSSKKKSSSTSSKEKPTSVSSDDEETSSEEKISSTSSKKNKTSTSSKKKTSTSSKKKTSSKKVSSKKVSSKKTSTSSKKPQSSKKESSSSKVEELEEVYYTQEEKIYYGLDPEMYEIGLKNAGNSARIAALMKKAQNGGNYKIAVLGGSISEGAKASNSFLSYGNLICEWWCANFPDATFEFINAGFGSTNPEMACYRMEEDLLKQNPDFVVVDFTVNTYLDNDLYNTYSTILYKILSQKNAPAVMSIDFTNCDREKHDYAMTYVKTKSVPVGPITDAVEAYDIPAMSYHNYIWKKIKDGIIRWPDIGGDYIHPNDNGHMTAASLITSHLKEVLNNLDKYSGEITAPTKPDVSDYLNLGYIINTADGITMSGGFKNRSTNRPSGKGWEYKVGSDASTLTIPVPQNKNIKVFMKFDEGSEGEITVTDSNNKTYTIYSDEAATPTLVEIGKMSGKITFNPNMTKGGFQIYGIGVKK